MWECIRENNKTYQAVTVNVDISFLQHRTRSKAIKLLFQRINRTEDQQTYANKKLLIGRCSC